MGIYKLVVIGILAVLIVGIYFYTHRASRELRIATTTSLYNTGLLDFIVDKFNDIYPEVEVKILALGSGAALETAARGDADLVIVHAPSLERKYIDMGVLIRHKILTYNYFVLVGPSNDPAEVRNADSIIEAFRRIYSTGSKGKAVFISRGDNSGTHVKELSIWKMAGIEPGGDWYIESGSGMAQTLVIADEKNGYTLSDIGTYVYLKENGRINNLEILYSNDEMLINIYSIYIVNPDRFKDINYDDAKLFYEFVLKNIGNILYEYNNRFPVTLFHPIYESDIEWLEGKWLEMAGG